MKARAEFVATMGSLDPAKLVFLDESGFATNLARQLWPHFVTVGKNIFRQCGRVDWPLEMEAPLNTRYKKARL